VACRWALSPLLQNPLFQARDRGAESTRSLPRRSMGCHFCGRGGGRRTADRAPTFSVGCPSASTYSTCSSSTAGTSLRSLTHSGALVADLAAHSTGSVVQFPANWTDIDPNVVLRRQRSWASTWETLGRSILGRGRWVLQRRPPTPSSAMDLILESCCREGHVEVARPFPCQDCWMVWCRFPS
jgi:hypothetical protein